MAPYWLRYGILYGIIGISIGTIAAATRAIFINYDNIYFVLTAELIIVAILICSYGLFLMKKSTKWTTISALNYGFVGSFLYLIFGTIINFVFLESNLTEIINNVTLTHGYYYLVIIVLMSMTPVVATQRA